MTAGLTIGYQNTVCVEYESDPSECVKEFIEVYTKIGIVKL